MTVPVICFVYSDSNLLGFRSFIQCLSVNVVGSLYDLSFIGDPYMFALVWYRHRGESVKQREA